MSSHPTAAPLGMVFTYAAVDGTIQAYSGRDGRIHLGTPSPAYEISFTLSFTLYSRIYLFYIVAFDPRLRDWLRTFPGCDGLQITVDNLLLWEQVRTEAFNQINAAGQIFEALDLFVNGFLRHSNRILRSFLQHIYQPGPPAGLPFCDLQGQSSSPVEGFVHPYDVSARRGGHFGGHYNLRFGPQLRHNGDHLRGFNPPRNPALRAGAGRNAMLGGSTPYHAMNDGYYQARPYLQARHDNITTNAYDDLPSTFVDPGILTCDINELLLQPGSVGVSLGSQPDAHNRAISAGHATFQQPLDFGSQSIQTYTAHDHSSPAPDSGYSSMAGTPGAVDANIDRGTADTSPNPPSHLNMPSPPATTSAAQDLVLSGTLTMRANGTAFCMIGDCASLGDTRTRSKFIRQGNQKGRYDSFQKHLRAKHLEETRGWSPAQRELVKSVLK